MNCPWCHNPLKHSDEDDIFICNCMPNENDIPSCHAVILNGVAVNFVIWYPPKKISLIKTGHLWQVYVGHFTNDKIAGGKNEDLTLEEAVTILMRYANLRAFI